MTRLSIATVPAAMVGPDVGFNCSTRPSGSEGDNGLVLNQETKHPFSYSDASVEKGLTFAYNEAASNQARAYVRAFLKEVFALKRFYPSTGTGRIP